MLKMAAKGKDFISKQHPISANRMLLIPLVEIQEYKDFFQTAEFRKEILEVGRVYDISS